MKTKKMPILLLSGLLLTAPITSFADQKIDMDANPEITEMQYEDGNREIKDLEDNKSKDVEKESETKTSFENEDKKEEDKEKTKEKNSEDKKESDEKEDVKEEELGQKDVSVVKDEPKEYKLEVVDQIDEDQGANFITISSEDTEKNPLTGFVYTLKNETTGEEIDVNLKDTSEIIVKGSDGKYSLTLKDKPEEFEEEKALEFEMPYGEDGENKTRLLKLTPKHILKPEVPNTPNPETSDDRKLNLLPIGTILLAIVGLFSALIYDSKKKKKENE